MKKEKPDFRLRPADSACPGGPLELHALGEGAAEDGLTRRDFLGKGIGLSTALGLLGRGMAGTGAFAGVPTPDGVVRAHHTHAVQELVFSRRHGLLISGGYDRTVKFWAMPAGHLRAVLTDYPSTLAPLRLDAAESLLVVGDSARIGLYSLPDAAPLGRLTDGGALGVAHLGSITAMQLTPDGRYLVTGAYARSNNLKLWSIEERRLLRSLAGHTEALGSVGITRDGSLCVSGSSDLSVRLWHLPSGEPLGVLDLGATWSVSGVLLRPDGSMLVAITDGIVGIWSLPDGKLLQRLVGHQRGVAMVAVDPSWQWVATTAYDQTLKLWSLESGALVDTLPGLGSEGYARTQFFTEDGRTLVAATTQMLKAWVLPDLTATRASDSAEGQRRVTVSWQGRGTLMTSASANGPWERAPRQDRVQSLEAVEGRAFWRVEDGGALEVASITESQRQINSVALLQPEQLLVLGHGDRSGQISLRESWSGASRGYLFDPQSNETAAVSYDVVDPLNGRPITYTLPCGSGVPAGATCTCDCVPSNYQPPGGGGGGGGGCLPVCICMAIPSDRDLKQEFAPVDTAAILESLAGLPIQAWRYAAEAPGVRHLGPMAQDFAAAFALGDGDRHICAVDAHGVALAAIQALRTELRSTQAELASQRETIARLEEALRDRGGKR